MGHFGAFWGIARRLGPRGGPPPVTQHLPLWISLLAALREPVLDAQFGLSIVRGRMKGGAISRSPA